MWSIAVTVSLGIIIGFFLKWTEKMSFINSKFQVAGLSILLFLMGVSIGANPDIVRNLRLIGMKSLTFGATTVIFSVAAIYFTTKLIWRKNP